MEFKRQLVDVAKTKISKQRNADKTKINYPSLSDAP